MVRHCLIAAGLLLSFGCDKRNDRHEPTAAQRQAVATADNEKARAEVEKRRADQALEAAKERKKAADEQLDKAKDWADDVRDKADLDDDKDRNSDAWAHFASGRDRTEERGAYTFERGNDGSIAAWRRNRAVAATEDRDDDAIERDVKARLADSQALQGAKIDVDSKDQVVSLSGDVRSAADASRAVRAALSVPGVEKVVSHLSFDAAK